MRKFFLVGLAGFLLSCSSNDDAKEEYTQECKGYFDELATKGMKPKDVKIPVDWDKLRDIRKCYPPNCEMTCKKTMICNNVEYCVLSTGRGADDGDEPPPEE